MRVSLLRTTARRLMCLLLLGLSCAPLRADDDFPAELVSFAPHPANPIFTAADPDDWDARLRERGWILRDGQRWLMWYTGYDGERTSTKFLGLATSSDGIVWERHPANPLVKEHWLEDMMVVRQDGTFYMFAEGRDDQAQLLSSKDGVAWSTPRRIDVRKADGTPLEPGPYGTPTGYFEKGIWYLFYERRDAGIWLAKSRDMQVWTNVQDEPVLSPGPDLFDRDLIALNQIVPYRGRYYAYFHGASDEHTPRLWACGVAVSDDLIHWKKYAGNPLQPIAQNKSSGILVPDGKGFRFYTMHDKVELHLPQ